MFDPSQPERPARPLFAIVMGPGCANQIDTFTPCGQSWRWGSHSVGPAQQLLWMRLPNRARHPRERFPAWALYWSSPVDRGGVLPRSSTTVRVDDRRAM